MFGLWIAVHLTSLPALCCSEYLHYSTDDHCSEISNACIHIEIPCSSSTWAKIWISVLSVQKILWLHYFTRGIYMLQFIHVPSNWGKLANAGNMPAATLGDTFWKGSTSSGIKCYVSYAGHYLFTIMTTTQFNVYIYRSNWGSNCTSAHSNILLSSMQLIEMTVSH